MTSKRFFGGKRSNITQHERKLKPFSLPEHDDFTVKIWQLNVTLRTTVFHTFRELATATSCTDPALENMQTKQQSMSQAT